MRVNHRRLLWLVPAALALASCLTEPESGAQPSPANPPTEPRISIDTIWATEDTGRWTIQLPPGGRILFRLTDLGVDTFYRARVRSNVKVRIEATTHRDMARPGYGKTCDSPSWQVQLDWNVDKITRGVLIFTSLDSTAAGTVELDLGTTVRGELPDSLEPDGTLQTASAQMVGTTVRRTILPWDVDWIRFHADSGQPYEIGLPTIRSLELGLVDADSNPLLPARESWNDLGHWFNWVCPKSGDYYIRVADPGNAEGYWARVDLDTFSLPYLDSYEPDRTPGQAKLLPTDSTAQQRGLMYHDSDWIELRLDSGLTYRIDAEDDQRHRIHLLLHDVDSAAVGAAVTLSDDTLTRITFRCPRTGRYRLLVDGYGGRLSYRIRAYQALWDRSPDDPYEPDDTIDQAKPISVDGSAQERMLKPGTRDFVQFQADSGQGYALEIRGLPGSALHLYSPTGVALGSLATESQPDGSIRTRWRCGRTGTFSLAISGKTASTWGLYELRIATDAAPSPIGAWLPN